MTALDSWGLVALLCTIGLCGYAYEWLSAEGGELAQRVRRTPEAEWWARELDERCARETLGEYLDRVYGR